MIEIVIFSLFTTSAIEVNGEYFLFDAAVEYLPRDLMFKWSFPAEDEVTFQYWIPHSEASFYGWAGIAIQDPRDARDHFRGDYYIAILDQNIENIQMTDRYGQQNGLAPQDTDLGCTNDIIESWAQQTDYFLIIYWTRKFVTGDLECDILLDMGKPVLVKWALGPVIDGYIEMHHMQDMGFEYFILAEFYLDNNEDERARYGPWWELHPQDAFWIDEFETPKGPDEATVLTASDY